MSITKFCFVLFLILCYISFRRVNRNFKTNELVMSILLSTWNTIRNTLFPFFKEVLEPLSEKEQQFVRVVTLMNVQQYACNYKRKGIGRKPADRIPILKAFIAEAVYNSETTEFLIGHLKKAGNLRRLCGWEYSFRVPSAPTFSRAFGQFSADNLGVKIHEANGYGQLRTRARRSCFN